MTLTTPLGKSGVNEIRGVGSPGAACVGSIPCLLGALKEEVGEEAEPRGPTIWLQSA